METAYPISKLIHMLMQGQNVKTQAIPKALLNLDVATTLDRASVKIQLQSFTVARRPANPKDPSLVFFTDDEKARIAGALNFEITRRFGDAIFTVAKTLNINFSELSGEDFLYICNLMDELPKQTIADSLSNLVRARSTDDLIKIKSITYDEEKEGIITLIIDGVKIEFAEMSNVGALTKQLFMDENILSLTNKTWSIGTLFDAVYNTPIDDFGDYENDRQKVLSVIRTLNDNYKKASQTQNKLLVPTAESGLWQLNPKLIK